MVVGNLLHSADRCLFRFIFDIPSPPAQNPLQFLSLEVFIFERIHQFGEISKKTHYTHPINFIKIFFFSF